MRAHLSILSLSLVAAATLLTPSTAEARRASPRDAEVRVVTAPRPAPRSGGDWERRVSEVWVPATQERVWIEKTCRERRGRGPHRRMVAYDCGRHEVRTVPGYLERHEEWVWVPRPVTRPRVSVHLPMPLGIDIRLSL